MKKLSRREISDLIVTVAGLLFLTLFGLITFCRADTVMNGLTPVAVNQGGQPYCGEAASAEALFSAGWAKESTAQQTFDVLTNYFNAPIFPSWGISYYLSTYYPNVNTGDVMDVGPNTIAEIKDDVDKGWAVDTSWFIASTGHALYTIGYEDDAQGAVTGLLYVNSWGNSSIFEMSPLGFYGTGDLREVVGLAPESSYTPSPPIVVLPPPPIVVKTPEPSALLLIALGILSYLAFVVGVGKMLKWRLA